jgi:hypothetical protein
MFSLYVFSLIVGGGLLLFSLFGGGEEADGDLSGGADADAPNPVQWLSLRSLMYFLFVFGGIGAVLSKAWPSAAAPLVAALSVAGGLGVGAAVSAAFNYLRRTDSGMRGGDETFIGLSGRVTLPFGEGGLGKILVTRADRTFELMARPFGDASGDPRSWKAVIVVEMSRGTAMVSPLDEPAANELSSLDHP